MASNEFVLLNAESSDWAGPAPPVTVSRHDVPETYEERRCARPSHQSWRNDLFEHRVPVVHP